MDQVISSVSIWHSVWIFDSFRCTFPTHNCKLVFFGQGVGGIIHFREAILQGEIFHII